MKHRLYREGDKVRWNPDGILYRRFRKQYGEKGVVVKDQTPDKKWTVKVKWFGRGRKSDIVCVDHIVLKVKK